MQRVPLVRPTLVIGIVEKPRRMYLMSEQQLGCPVFDLQGRLLGISVHHLSSSRSNGLIVLPAADIAEITQQAVIEAAKPPPPKPAVEAPVPEKRVEKPGLPPSPDLCSA